jgi:hypothetical protein
MSSVSNLNEGRRVDANIVLIDAVIQNNTVVDEFLTELWLITVAMVLIHRYLIGLHDVEIFSLHLGTQNF